MRNKHVSFLIGCCLSFLLLVPVLSQNKKKSRAEKALREKINIEIEGESLQYIISQMNKILEIEVVLGKGVTSKDPFCINMTEVPLGVVLDRIMELEYLEAEIEKNKIILQPSVSPGLDKKYLPNPEIGKEKAKKKLREITMTVNFKGTTAGDVLEFLTFRTGIDIIMGPEICPGEDLKFTFRRSGVPGMRILKDLQKEHDLFLSFKFGVLYVESNKSRKKPKIDFHSGDSQVLERLLKSARKNSISRFEKEVKRIKNKRVKNALLSSLQDLKSLQSALLSGSVEAFFKQYKTSRFASHPPGVMSAIDDLLIELIKPLGKKQAVQNKIMEWIDQLGDRSIKKRRKAQSILRDLLLLGAPYFRKRLQKKDISAEMRTRLKILLKEFRKNGGK